MSETQNPVPLLSVVTVVRNDPAGLKATMASLRERLAQPLEEGAVEHIVIDGSTNDEIRNFLLQQAIAPGSWVSESDRGIYDAMNKGLERARGRYVLFMNAGDVFSSFFDWRLLVPHLRGGSRVLLAYAVECFGNDRYLRPGLGREGHVFGAPSHQSTFYPQAFFAQARYRLDLPVKGDGDYTKRAIEQVGALFLPTVVAEFALGGVSSNYTATRVLRRRLAEQEVWRERAKLLIKFVLWRLVPQRWFYRVLAWGKYTPLDHGGLPGLRAAPLEGPAGRAG
jgi:putative colanic acid biosynthesis glycosyltransferase